MRKLIFWVFACSITMPINAQVRIVKEFGTQLSSWAETQSFTYLENATNFYNSSHSGRGQTKSIISDYIANDLAKRNGIPSNTSYEMDMFMGWLDKEVSKGLSISFHDIQAVAPGLVKKKYYKAGFNFATARIKIDGNVDYNVVDLFCIQDDKILKMDTYEESIDKKTGKKKVKVDLRDFYYDKSFGVTYNYGWHFPVGISMSYTYLHFYCSVDCGITFDNDEYTTQKVSITDLANYEICKGTYKPKFFVTASPGVFIKYFSISCGVGILYMKGTEETNSNHLSVSSNGDNISVSSGSSNNSTPSDKVKPMIRPSVKGYIPCNMEWSVVAGAGYDYAFGYKDKNGINFSLGFQYNFD